MVEQLVAWLEGRMGGRGAILGDIRPYVFNTSIVFTCIVQFIVHRIP